MSVIKLLSLSFKLAPVVLWCWNQLLKTLFSFAAWFPFRFPSRRNSRETRRQEQGERIHYFPFTSYCGLGHPSTVFTQEAQLILEGGGSSFQLFSISWFQAHNNTPQRCQHQLISSEGPPKLLDFLRAAVFLFGPSVLGMKLLPEDFIPVLSVFLPIPI